MGLPRFRDFSSATTIGGVRADEVQIDLRPFGQGGSPTVGCCPGVGRAVRRPRGGTGVELRDDDLGFDLQGGHSLDPFDGLVDFLGPCRGARLSNVVFGVGSSK